MNLNFDISQHLATLAGSILSDKASGLPDGVSELLTGAQAKLGDVEGFLQQQQTPEAAMLMDLMSQILLLLQQLNQRAPQPMGGGAAAGGGGHSGGAHASKGAGSPRGSRVDGPGGFLWKPKSESDGNLVVLLPNELRGQVDSVEIKKDGVTLESGRFTGDTKNGNRPHFRFDKPGAGYGDNVEVVARLSNGETRTFRIDQGAARHD